MKRKKKGERKFALGYIYSDRKLGKDEKAFLKIAKKNNVELVMFNIIDKINEKELEERAKKCDIIFNNSAEIFAEEIVKTFEQLGKRVIDSSKAAYYPEDKWIFYMECKKNKIPVPETILLSENISAAKKELEDFKRWPVVIKRVEGTHGEYVEKADNPDEAEKIMKRFWKKGSERIPMIAQEFIANSPSYRVTLIGDRIVQTAIKNAKGWKKIGVYEKRIERFELDKKLIEIAKKVSRMSGIKIIGIDLLKKNKNWVVLEVNAQPGLDFFNVDEEKIVQEIINYLKKLKK